MPRLAAIGPATAEALGGADLVPAVATQEGLLAELPRPAGRVLFAAAEGARTLLPDELGADVVVLYRTRELRPTELPAADLVVLASASAARALGGARRRSAGRLDRARDLAGGARGRARVVAEARSTRATASPRRSPSCRDRRLSASP